MQSTPLLFVYLFSYLLGVLFCQILIKSYLLPLPTIIVVRHTFQVVRYHSLVMDFESLPEELIPIAWTSSTSTLPFFGSKDSHQYKGYEIQTDPSIHVDSFLPEVGNGSSEHFYHGKNRNARVLMGVKHSTRPHYGVQV